MKKIFFLPLTLLLVVLAACGGSADSTQTLLDPAAFEAKIKSTDAAQVIDVRTPGEYEGGHIENSVNIDWNNSDFANQIKNVDKSKPVFVYCLSGGRSGEAVNFMSKNGFTEIYELEGGMLAWRSSSMPETTDVTVPESAEMSADDFAKLLNTEKYVLVDFHAEWCAPCKKLKPILDEIGSERADDVTIVRIDVDENPSLSKQLNVSGIPDLRLYKNGKLTWETKGLVAKSVIVEQLK